MKKAFKNKIYQIFLSLFVIAGMVILVWYFFQNHSGDFSNYFQSKNNLEQEYIVPPLVDEYKNTNFDFSFKLPEGFRVREMETAIIIENDSAEGLQIAITPIDQDIPHLTEDIIKNDIPDLDMREVETVEIGEDNTGVAFKSDNEAFAGKSREVWFVFKGNLYQISTYENLDPLLKAIFSTWQFS